MKTIPLSQGYSAIVDDEDYDMLMKFQWCYHKGYAVRHLHNKHAYMHRVVNNTPEDLQTDHINLNRLDNRRANLRSVTRAGNNVNRPVKASSSSRFKGVHLDERYGSWIAQIKPIGKPKIHLGSFNDEINAATAYNLGVALYGDESTRLNIGG